MTRIKQRRPPALHPQPPHVGKVVVRRRHEIPRHVGPRGRVENQIVFIRRRPAPHMGEHRLRPTRRGGKTERPRELVPPAPDPPRLMLQVHAPVDVPIHRRPRIHRPAVRRRRLAARPVQRPPRHPPPRKPRPPPRRPPPPHPPPAPPTPPP